MNFSKLIGQKNVLLLPFSWLYKAGIWVYHKLFELRIKQSYQPNLPTICIGNLSVGGTGKSPMVEYLLRLLKNDFSVAVISRGYGRKTVGFVLANEATVAGEIGDEPMQFHQKFFDVAIAVGEKRVDAIQQLRKRLPNTNVIILDDAFQHRSVIAGINILLTDYNNLYNRDWYLPAGTLRDLKSSAKRADIIVVTKTDVEITSDERLRIVEELNPLPNQSIFFTAIHYGVAYNIFTKAVMRLDDTKSIILVTGIANAEPLLGYLDKFEVEIQHLNYGDHHHFSLKDIYDIKSTYRRTESDDTIILTTEKDAMRLREWNDLKLLPMFALPIEHQFLFDGALIFNNLILDYVKPK